MSIFVCLPGLQVSHVRNVHDQPFGGVQVILSGDFLQLPPVRADAMAFESSVWQELNLKHITLQQNFRTGVAECCRTPVFRAGNII